MPAAAPRPLRALRKLGRAPLLLSVLLLSGCRAESEPGDVPEAPAPEAPAAETPALQNPVSSSEDSGSPAEPPTVAAAARPSSSVSDTFSHQVRFEPVAQKLGIQHTYQNGATGQLLMVESIGGGVGWLDVNNDGLPDLFCGQGGDPTKRDPSDNPSDQLFVQRVGGQFEAVTHSAGIIDFIYGQGVTVGDFDNDGFDDVYVTNVGRNQLFHNCGDGTFAPVVDAACVLSNCWSSSAAWADVDLDGDLDLYVCNYLKYDPLDPFPCEKDGQPALCHPRQLDDWPDEFFLNNGDGTFQSLAEQRGLTGEGNKALGVVIADLNGDRWPDIYVANDTTANFYFVNQQDGTFVDSSLKLGGGLNAEGAMQASMGIAAGDYDGSGTIDLFLTHFTGESNTLYQNLQDIGLYDVSGKSGLHPISNPKLGFGTVMADFDANGRMELLIANGHIDSRHADGDGFQQRPQVLSYDGRKWHDLGQEPSDYFAEKHVGRGIATCDYDGDGDPDVVIAHQNEPLEVLQNTSTGGGWLKIVPISDTSNRSGIGTSAEVETEQQTWYSSICGGTSFAASHEHALFFGLGEADHIRRLTVRWPGGKELVLSDVDLNQILTVREPRP